MRLVPKGVPSSSSTAEEVAVVATGVTVVRMPISSGKSRPDDDVQTSSNSESRLVSTTNRTTQLFTQRRGTVERLIVESRGRRPALIRNTHRRSTAKEKKKRPRKKTVHALPRSLRTALWLLSRRVFGRAQALSRARASQKSRATSWTRTSRATASVLRTPLRKS